MQVHLIRKETIKDFNRFQPRSRSAFEDWIAKVKITDWQRPADIKKTFNSADLLGQGSSRIIFDLGGNNFRMICKYVFGRKQVHLFICWIGSHAEYDKLCKECKQSTINNY